MKPSPQKVDFEGAEDGVVLVAKLTGKEKRLDANLIKLWIKLSGGI